MVKSKSMKFALALLRKNHTRSYESVKKAASAKGVKMWPIVYGRALSYLREAGVIAS